MVKELIFKTRDGVKLFMYHTDGTIQNFTSDNPDAVYSALKQDLNSANYNDRNMAQILLTNLYTYGVVKKKEK
jgi:hypothetical protein